MQLGIQAPKPAPTPTFSLGGLVSAKPLSTLLAEEANAAAAQRAANSQNDPVMQSIAGHIRRHWTLAKEAKETIEQEMLSAVRSRRGEYDSDKLASIKQQGGSEIYMMLFATKARQAKALLTDVLVGAGTEKPWTITPTPEPELPPDEVDQIMQAIYTDVAQAEMMGLPMSVSEIRQKMVDAKQMLENQILETARIYAQKAERKIEDMMVEGGYMHALDQFLDDLMVFKTAFLKGPVVRNIPQLSWAQGQDGTFQPQVVSERKVEWERVDPFNIYPAPWAKSVHDGFLIERHKLSRADLNAMIGVDGYSEDAIKDVIREHGSGGLHEWLSVDTDRASAEGRDSLAADVQRSDLIDALQYWGSVSGQMLRDWGMDETEVPDETKEYEVEAWLVGTHVIKAVLNPDPLARRPYYADGYSRIPGAFWHNSLFDVVRDCQDMCNSAARALANNLGIASGPQVVVNIDRLPSGEDITQMYPWKIWQMSADPMGSSAAPVSFFQPNSNASELMGVFEKFSQIADEVSGIPKYLTGFTGGEGGAGRTASGMSMMVGNATKQVKQIISSIDLHIIGPSVERAYQWVMMYMPENGLRGDLKVMARGALSLLTKEAAQVRRNEFLQFTGNPIDMQILGLEGRAEILRESAKSLNLNPDKIVPSTSVLRERAAMAQMAMMQQAAAQQGQPGGQPDADRNGGSGQALTDGTPTTDNFSPTRR
jgi:hypothetical protein